MVVISGCGPLGLGMVAGARQKQPKVLITMRCVIRNFLAYRNCYIQWIFNTNDLFFQIQLLFILRSCISWILFTILKKILSHQIYMIIIYIEFLLLICFLFIKLFGLISLKFVKMIANRDGLS